eukprot:Plantae.Rhodophyta-Hildenbrandia_rubra.ctg11874.p1 GENE.Plantae.Rhodophyta-Hildenbrandia_rubra.ctg11874~~Plantae.Rhodophyta-Hildenbrandia_rubra.ctg11874.p1  ORF type:complete len:606 (-),score=107.31 Plantae.Rhodophyta-Hildenbrandia_rubra.ctg11874:2493-4310(-)
MSTTPALVPKRSTRKRKARAAKIDYECPTDAMKRICEAANRTSLEQCMLQMLSGELGCEDALDWLKETLPEHRRNKRRCIRTKVTQSPSLISTGHFRGLDAYVTGLILKELSFVDRLSAVTAVCTGWRSMMGDKEIWRDVEVKIDDRLSIGGAMRALKETVPGNAIRSLHVEAEGRSIDARDVRRLVKGCKDAFGGVEKLELYGKKILAACLNDLGGLGFMQQLRWLMLDGVNVKLNSVTHCLLKNTPNLVSLKMNVSAGDWSRWYFEDHVDMISRALSDARDGGTPLLSELVLCGLRSSTITSFSIQAFAKLGARFPELEQLRLPNIPKLHEGVNLNMDRVKMEDLPRLRELDFQIGDEYRVEKMDAERVNGLMTRVAASAPALEKLTVVVGRSSRFPTNCSKAEPVVLLSLASPLSRTLRELSLEYLQLDDVSFGISFELPVLHHLKLTRSGDKTFLATNLIAAGSRELEQVEVYDPCFNMYDDDSERMKADVHTLGRLDAPSLKMLVLSRIGEGVGKAVNELVKNNQCLQLQKIEVRRGGLGHSGYGKSSMVENVKEWLSRQGTNSLPCNLSKSDLEDKNWRFVAVPGKNERAKDWITQKGD